MKEIVIISGKGGTGKTSLTASFAALAAAEAGTVIADCDVDAADLHLVLNPEIRLRTDFISGHVAELNNAVCAANTQGGACASCLELCRFGAFSRTADGGITLDQGSCEGCGVCVRFCPSGAISFPDRYCGEWFVSKTRFGSLVHAALATRAENSGKLVTTVRKEAKRLATEQGASFILVDGSPGTGCPVIASITGADSVLVVSEPTLSGQHDLERVVSLARHFKIAVAVCVNKADINIDQARATQTWCERNAIPFLGMIPYDRVVTAAQIQGQTIIERIDELARAGNIESAKTGSKIREIWEKLCQLNR